MSQVFRDTLRLSIPLVVGQLAFASMSFIDTLLMGQLSVEAIAGGGLGSVVYQFCYVVGIGVLIATANLIAFAKGESKPEAIHGALLAGVIVVLMLFVFFGLLILFSPPLLLALEQAENVVVIADRYLSVVVWALLPGFGFILLRSLILGVGDPALILPISVLAAASNYPVSYVLMTGQLGLPALGIEGIALGTCIVTLGMFVSLCVMVYRKPAFRNYPFWSGWQCFNWSQLKESLRLGIPMGLAHAMEIGLFSAAAILVGWLGVEALAAHQVALQCTTLSFMIPLGISQAVSVKVGEYYGARQLDFLRASLRSGLLMGTASASLAGMVFILIPESLTLLFLREDVSSLSGQTVVLTAIGILFVAAFWQLVDAWQVILMGALRGFKLGASPTAITILTYWFIGFPAAYLLLEPLGAVGVWLGLGAGLASSALFLGGLYIYVRNRRFPNAAVSK